MLSLIQTESRQVRNEYEQSLIDPVIRTLADGEGYGLDAEEGLGVVVPHRAQRAALREAFPQLCVFDQASGLAVRSAIDVLCFIELESPARQ